MALQVLRLNSVVYIYSLWNDYIWETNSRIVADIVVSGVKDASKSDCSPGFYEYFDPGPSYDWYRKDGYLEAPYKAGDGTPKVRNLDIKEPDRDKHYCTNLIVERTHVGAGRAYVGPRKVSDHAFGVRLYARPIGDITDQVGSSIGVSLFVKFVVNPSQHRDCIPIPAKQSLVRENVSGDRYRFVPK